MKALILAASMAVLSGSPPATVGITYLINENFEGTGTPSGWGGTADFDSTTSPLAGAQSLRVNNQTVQNEAAIDNGDLWFKFLFKPNQLPTTDSDIFYINDASFNELGRIIMETNGKLIATQDGIFEETSSALSSGTMYYVWVRYVKGSGSNSVVQVYFNTSDSRPSFGDSKTAGASNGSETANVTKLFLTFEHIADFDNVQVAATDF